MAEHQHGGTLPTATVWRVKGRLGWLSVAALLTLLACGTTVPVAQRQSTSGGATDKFGGAPGSTGGDSAAAAGANHGVTEAAASTGRRTAATSGGATSAGVAGGIGSHTPVEVGIGVDKNNAAFAAAFGASTSQPEEDIVAEAVVADINRHGGLAGHPLTPVYAAFDSTSTDWIAEDERACSTFTEDHHVIAVVRTDDIFGPLDSCVTAARVPLVLYESYFRAPSWFAAAPSLRFVPDNPSPVRLYRALVDRMVATKRWTPATKIGLVRYDRADQAEVETKGVRPALAAHGLSLTDARAVHTPESFQDIGATSSQLPSVILRFRQQGITDVVFEGGDISYLFATEAQSQRYTPRYALTSFDFPNAMPPEQLHGAFGVGWEPTDDLSRPLPVVPGVKRCQDATRATNADYGAAGVDRIYITCDSLYFLQAAYNAAGDVGPGAFERGARRLGASLPAAFTFAIDTSSRTDGAAAVRDLFFDERCACLAYGPESKMP
jgi:hypothetical protein